MSALTQEESSTAIELDFEVTTKLSQGYQVPVFTAVLPAIKNFSRCFPVLYVSDEKGASYSFNSAQSASGWQYEEYPGVFVYLTSKGITETYTNGKNKVIYTPLPQDGLSVERTYRAKGSLTVYKSDYNFLDNSR